MTSNTIKRELRDLRGKLRQTAIPAPTARNFRLLTWNLRNLNKDKEDRAIKYIAEICKRFDIIAIQEAKRNLGGLEKLQKALGRRYRFIFSDVAGNGERLVFVYDSACVQFTGLAAEIVMSPGSGREKVKRELEFDRTPFMASFRINGCNFIIVTVHIYYGKGKAIRYRLEELRNIAKYLKKNSKDTDALDSDYVACGDFNIEKTRFEVEKRRKKHVEDKELFKALRSGGLIIPKVIQDSPSNLKKTKHFDQIGFHKYKDSTLEFQTGGTIDFTDVVYVGDEKIEYKLSDHLPMWASFNTERDKKPKYINPDRGQKFYLE